MLPLLNNWTETQTRFLRNCLVIYLAYSICRFIAWHLSTNLELIDSVASWFLPAGLRLSAFLLLKPRYWPAILLGEYSVVLTLYVQVQQYNHLLYEIVGGFSPALMYMAGALIYFKYNDGVNFSSVRNSINLLVSITLSAVVTGAFLSPIILLDSPNLEASYLEIWFSYALGDLVGIFLVLPLAYVAKSLITKSITLTGKDTFSIFIPLLVIAVVMLQLANLDSSTIYYMKVFAVIPVIWFAYRNGWLGAFISAFVINMLFVAIHILAGDVAGLAEKQFYILILSTTGMMLGAAVSEKNDINSKLQTTNDRLLKLNNRLSDLSEQNRKFAKELVDIQENERKVIARELHDEIGQNITAIKTSLKLLKNTASKAGEHSLIEKVDEIADSTYESAYNLMHWLRPQELDDLGLIKSLKSKKFENMLAAAGINYHVSIKGTDESLDDRAAIAIYRIVQECINNAIKHSKADTLSVKLDLSSELITLSVKDNGIGFDRKQASGRGLSGITDRVSALGGEHIVDSSSSGTSHRVLIGGDA